MSVLPWDFHTWENIQDPGKDSHSPGSREEDWLTSATSPSLTAVGWLPFLRFWCSFITTNCREHNGRREREDIAVIPQLSQHTWNQSLWLHYVHQMEGWKKDPVKFLSLANERFSFQSGALCRLRKLGITNIFTEESIPILESPLLGHGSEGSHCFTLSNPRIPKCSKHCPKTK